MKKLILTAVVTMLGIAANAMAVNWKYTGASADKNSTVYVMLGTTAQTEWANLAAIQSAAIGHETITKNGVKYTASGIAKDDAVTKSSASLYYVIVNATEDKFSVSSVADAKAFVYDIDNLESAPDVGFTGIGTGNMGTPSDFSGAAPEPTSAMLMLLGVAGLALKRKRA